MLSFLNFIPGMSYIKIAAVGLAAIAVVSTIGLGYHQYTSLEADNLKLSVEKQQMETALVLQKDLIEQQKQAINKWSVALDDYRKAVTEYSQIQQRASFQQRRISNVSQKHDLARDAAASPALVERRLNSGSADAWSMFRCVSGGSCAGSPAAGAAPAAGGVSTPAPAGPTPPH